MTETRPPCDTNPPVRPAVDKLLKLIHREIKIFPPLVRLRHGSLDIEIPEGALHFPGVEVFPERDWGSLVMRMEVHGTRVEAACALRESSDASAAEMVETLWDMQEGESAYKIVNASLCLGDARQFVAYLVSAFFPWTLNIRTTEGGMSAAGPGRTAQ